MTDTDFSALAKRALDLAGGGARVGRVFGIAKSTVQTWKTSRVPDRYALRLARLAMIPPEEIRPDIFAPPAAAPAAHVPTPSAADADMVGTETVVGASS